MRTKIISMTALVLVLLLLSLSIASAATSSPLTGLQRGVDADGSNLQVSIAEGGDGIYRLTMHDDFWSFCDGYPGTGRGVGTIDAIDPDKLHTDWLISCPTLNIRNVGFQFPAVYDEVNEILTLQYANNSGTADLSRVGHQISTSDKYEWIIVSCSNTTRYFDIFTQPIDDGDRFARE